MLKIKVVASVDDQMGLSRNNRVPWCVPGHHRQMIEKSCLFKINAFIYGRRTWESIPPGERNECKHVKFILSRSVYGPKERNVFYYSTFDEILNRIVEVKEQIDNVWVCGGKSLYTMALDSHYFFRLYLTHIKGDFQCDNHFPSIDELVETELTSGKSTLTDSNVKVYRRQV